MAPSIIRNSLLSRQRQIVTRYQERRISSTFNFLKLPAEIRTIIYDLCLDTDSIQNILDRYYHKLLDARDRRDVAGPLVRSRVPTVLLLNQQIYAEAVPLLQKCSILFDHGLLDLADLTHFANAWLFRNIGSITIADTGHKLLDYKNHKMLVTSWVGFMHVIEQLAQILSQGHKLKKLLITFTDTDLVPHMTQCWNADFICGFRDSIRQAINSLRRVHNVRCVTFNGIPEAFARELKTRMEGPAISFLDLPRELRDGIYAHAADWSDVTPQLRRTLANWTDKALPPPYPAKHTPTLLLLNRQITAEALPVLRKKPLTVIFPGDHKLHHQHQIPDLLPFISRRTLQTVQSLCLTLESWEWVYALESFLPILAEQRRLKTVFFSFKDSLKWRFLADPTQQYPDHSLHLSLSLFKNMRGLQSVRFEGDLPECYVIPLAQIMRMPVGVATGWPEMKAVKGDGSLVEVDDDND